MKRTLLLFILLLTAWTYNQAQTPNFSLVGFATQNGGTVGGNAATTITDVATAAELQEAIGGEKTYTPRIIRVTQSFDGGGNDITIKNCSHITIFGANDNILITGAPFIITNTSNLIIRNLKFTMSGYGGGKDIMEITTTSSNTCQNIWVDHCEFYNDTPTAAGTTSGSIKDKYDGLLDIKKNSEYITISWCYFHDHYKAILVGFTAGDTEDRKITLHHNRFVRINSRIPSYRGGTAHIYNNYFEGWEEGGSKYGNCIHAREDCNLLVENNYFTTLNRGVYWDPEDANEGFATGTGNIFTNVNHGFTAAGGTNPFTPPYTVDQDDASLIPDITLNYSGVGKINSYDDYGGEGDGNKAPVVTILSPENGTGFEAPANVNFSASATDEDGSVAKVEFYKDGELVKTFTEAPYEYTFSDLLAGTYTLIAKAYDDQGKFASRSVSVSVKAPTVEAGNSLFGATDTNPNDYFWFDENKDIINSLITNKTFSGDISFKATDPTKQTYTTHLEAIIVTKEGGSVVFDLPSCSTFKLYLTRTGGFGGSVSASTDGETWNTLGSLSGKAGSLEIDYSASAASKTPIKIKIENTSTGGLNIHGAKILLAKSGSQEPPVGIETPEVDKEVAYTRYYNLSGVPVNELSRHTIYIQETGYTDGSVKRNKVQF